MKKTLKVIVVILMMTVGGILYQYFFEESPDYMQSVDMFYWASVSAIIFWLNGLFN